MSDTTPGSTAPSPSTLSDSPKDWLIPATYIIPFVFIYTMIKKGTDSNYVWHSKNAAGMIVIMIVIRIAYQILWMFLTLGVLFQLVNLVNLLFFLLMVYGAWQGWNGKLPKLPVITTIGQRIPLEKWFKKSEAAPAQSTATAPSPAPAPEPTPTPAPVEPVAPVEPPTPPTTPAA